VVTAEAAPPPREDPAPPSSEEKHDEESNDKDEAPGERDSDDSASASATNKRSSASSSVSVSVKSDPPGSHVSAHSRSYGTTPVLLKLHPGRTYELTFTKPGYAPASKRYHVGAAAGGQTVRVTLKKLPEPAKKNGTPPPATPSAKPNQKRWWQFGR
jgi:hypothetical protein